jgi:hypothetical protein
MLSWGERYPLRLLEFSDLMLIRSVTMRVVKGVVETARIHFYPDATADSEMILTDGRRVLFPGIAPIPALHEIRAEGEAQPLAEIVQVIHPAISREGVQERVPPTRREAFYALYLQDVTAQVEYHRRSSLSANLTV